MSYQLEQEKETLRVGIIYVVFSCVTAIPLTIGDTSRWETVLICALNCGMGISCLWIAYLNRAKKEISREDLIFDMDSINTFPVPPVIDLIQQYRCANREDMTLEEKREVCIVENIRLLEMGRANKPAFADDFKAMMDSYRSGEFHKAMRYSSMKWLKAILLVARSRGDLVADRLLFEHFGIKRRYSKRGRRCSI